MRLRTVADTVRSLSKSSYREGPLPKPDYCPTQRTAAVVCGVESMSRHMTDEGWQLTEGLSRTGFLHCGYMLPVPYTDMETITHHIMPGTLVIQDQREWADDPAARLINTDQLSLHPEIFKVTVVKDAHHKPKWHADFARSIGCHAWIHYYHPSIVCKVAPYVRKEHLIRTYHSVNPADVPDFTDDRSGILMSGAVSSAYPLRSRIIQQVPTDMTIMRHPGYGNTECHTPNYLKTLSKFKVAICTSSVYGYALRKLIEATACGCRVVTDLPVDERLPIVEDNLIRVHPEIKMKDLAEVLRDVETNYDPEIQRRLAKETTTFYDYRRQTRLLACRIHELRNSYNE